MRSFLAMGPMLLAGALWRMPVFADAPAVRGAILHVGPGKAFALPSQAAAAAKDGDTVEIDAGVYPGDVAVWRASKLTIRGIGGRPVLDAKGHAAMGKGLWVIEGNDTTVENLELTGASVPDKNGAGIRLDGSGLTVRKCFFHDNEDGILANAFPDSDIVIENSEFDHNGQGDGYSHNMYIGHVHSFTLRGCYSHNAKAGHDVKSRAAANYILYNRISDEDTSDTSYLIDLPNGGASYVIGNVLRRGPNASQGILISFAEEGAVNPKQSLAVVNNTFANDRHDATFVRVAGMPTLKVVNNLFLGQGTPVSHAEGEVSHNLIVSPSDFVNAAAWDYHLAPGSAAIDAGAVPGSMDGFDLMPRFEYAPPASLKPRPVQGVLDMGAYERASAH